LPSIFAHALVPIALGVGLGSAIVPRRLLVAGALLAMLPDLDVIGFHYGIAYAESWGHRGATHSLLFAALVASLMTLRHRVLHSGSATTFWFLFAAMGSHGLLDTLTNGGLGIELAWPWSDVRYFAPWQVIEVSPIILTAFFSARGWAVLQSELVWVGLPCVLLMVVTASLRSAWARRQRI
jgi:inner membrane protein